MRSNRIALVTALAMLAGLLGGLFEREPRAARRAEPSGTTPSCAPERDAAPVLDEASSGGDVRLDDEEDSLPVGRAGRTLASGRGVWEPADFPPPVDPAAALVGAR